MQTFFKYKKELLYSLALFILLSGGSLYYVHTLQRQATQEYKKIALKENKILLDTTRKELNRQCDTIFDIKINQPHILKIMDEANDPAKRDVARKELFKLLEPTYKLLQKNGIRQFHFHLPDSISFLRFHKVRKYGDSLKGIRYSIDLLNKTKRIVRGFEEGRIFNGFRNVYPLFYHAKFVGTVEISYSIRAIAELLTSDAASYYGLLIDKKLVQKKVWSENRKYYLPSLLSNGYLWDKKAFIKLYGSDTFIKKLQKFEKKLRSSVADRLGDNHSFLLPFHFENKNYIVIFQSLKNIEGKPVGYIVSIKENNLLALRSLQGKTTTLVLLIVILLVAVLFFLFLKNERDIKERLSFISNYDPLTKLLNRRGYEIAYNALLQSHKRDPRPFSLLFLDIDHFKHINDTFGHDMGDLVLQKLAELLQKELRKSDIIARWSGEEFIVMLDNTDIKAAQKVAEKLRQVIDRYKDKKLPHFTISIGIVDGNEDEPLEKLVKKADLSLYKAKENGRNQVVVYQEF